jgi:hypothetical protein
MALTMAAAQANLFSQLIGPTMSVQNVSNLGGDYARYVTDFLTYSEKHWTTDGSDWANADYYDRAKIYYAWWQATGNSTYLDRANQLAVDYRDNYLVANNYQSSAYWSQIGGVALHYLVTGDSEDLKAVGKVADVLSNPWYLLNLGDVNAEMDNRTQARVLEALLYAAKLNAPSDVGNDWNALAKQALDKILSSQASDGGYHFAVDGGNVKPFMVGLLNDTLIQYYSNVSADPRIVQAIKSSLDYLWAHDWDPATKGFKYLDQTYGSEPSDPAPDLNNMITSGFAFVYQMTGDATYKERGDLVFKGGVEGGWLEGSKQFNQEYTSSYKYLAMMVDGTAPTVAPATTASTTTAAATTTSDPAGSASTPPSTSSATTSQVPAPLVALASDTGVSATDGVTKSGILSVQAASGATVAYSIDNGSNWTSSFTAKEGANTVLVHQTDSAGHVSAAANLTFTLDTKAPTTTLVQKLVSDTGASAVDGVTTDGHVNLSGVASEKVQSVEVWDDATKLGNAVLQSDQATWSYTGTLGTGTHQLHVVETDIAGNVGQSDNASAITVGPASAITAGPDAVAAPLIVSNTSYAAGQLTFAGTADPGSSVAIFDNGRPVTKVVADSTGNWSSTTGVSPSSSIQTFTAHSTDKAGNDVVASCDAMIGTRGGDTITSTVNADLMRGGRGADVFVFNSAFGKDVITDFNAGGRSHDTLKFSKALFASTSDVLSHAADGADGVVIFHGTDQLTLAGVHKADLSSADILIV